jgi:hypothetical protein
MLIYLSVDLLMTGIAFRCRQQAAWNSQSADDRSCVLRMKDIFALIAKGNTFFCFTAIVIN